MKGVRLKSFRRTERDSHIHIQQRSCRYMKAREAISRNAGVSLLLPAGFEDRVDAIEQFCQCVTLRFCEYARISRIYGCSIFR